MNKAFKSVWNRVRQCYVAVDENKSTQRNSGKMVKTITLGSMLVIGGVLSLPNATAADVTIDELKTAIEGATGASRYEFSDTLNNAGTGNKSVLVIGTEPTEQNPDTNYLSWQPSSNVLSLVAVTGVTGGLQINDGYKFKLIGTETPAELTDGPVAINNGEFGLGSEVENSPLKGNVQKVVAEKGSKFIVYGGNYTVGEYVSNSGEANQNNSQVEVKRTGNLTVNKFTSYDSTINNDGLLTVGTYSTAEGSTANVVNNNLNGTLIVQNGLTLNGGRFDNRGTVNASDVQLSVVGAFNNQGTDEKEAVVNAKSITVSDNGVAGDGFTNYDYSKVVANEITFLSGRNFLNTTRGSIEVKKLNIVPTDAAVGLSFANSGETILSDLNIGSKGEFENDGILKVKGGATSQGQINGLLTNLRGGSIQGQNNGKLTIGSGGAIDTRNAEIDGIDLDVTGTAFGDMASQKQAILANNNSKIALNKFTVNTDNKEDVVVDFTRRGLNVVPTFKTMNVTTGTLKFGNLTNAEIAKNGVMNVGASGVVSFNNGVLEALTNNGEVTASGSFSTPNGINTEDGTLTVKEFISNVGDKFINQGSFELSGDSEPVINGQFINDSGSISGKWTNLSVGSSGEYVNRSGDIQFQGATLANGGQLTLKGGNVVIGALTDGGAGAVVNFEGGTAQLGNGWFDGATLNFKDGQYKLADITSAGGSFGNNIVNIGKEGQDFPTSGDNNHIESDSLDNFASVTVDKLNFDSTINVNGGGLLNANAIDFSQGDKTLTLNGGALKTSMNQLFAIPESNQEGLLVGSGDKVEIGSEYFNLPEISGFVVGVENSNKLAFGDNGGHVVFNDSEYSGQNVAKAVELLGGISGGKDVTVNFTGNFSNNSDFNLTRAENLLGSGIEGVGQPGVILSKVTLSNYFDNEAPDNGKALIIGEPGGSADANVLNVPNAIGFMNIAKADSVTVENGKQLILVGSEGDGKLNLLADAADGGTANVKGTLTLGSDYVETPTSGSIHEVAVSDEGNLNVQQGQFEVTSLHVDGQVNVTQKGNLTLGQVTGNGNIQNSGNIVFADGAHQNLVAKYVGDSTSTLDATKVAKLVVSSLVSAGKNLYKNLTVAGTAENAGTDSGEELTVEKDGSYSNAGEAGWKTLIGTGKVTNSGKLSVTSTAAGFIGQLVNNKDLTLGDAANPSQMTFAGTYHGAAGSSLNAEGVEKLTVTNEMVNNGKALYNNLEVLSGGKAENGADGSETGKILAISGAYSNAGTATWNGVQIQKGADFNNTGTLRVKDSLDWTGTLNNDGTLVLGFETPHEVMTFSGDYVGGTNSRLDATNIATLSAANIRSDGETNYRDLLVTEGGSVVNGGKETGSVLTVKGDYQNKGNASWDAVKVEGTALSEGTLSVKDAVTVASSGEFTSLASDVSEFGKLVSEGNVNLTGNHNIGALILSGDNKLDVNNGVMKVAQAELKGGLITAGYAVSRTGENTSVQFDSLIAPFDSTAVFSAGTTVGFGENSLDKVSAFRSSKGHTGSVVVVNKGVELGANGGLYVGTEESASADAPKSVVFASNSATLINVDQTYQASDSAFTLSGQKLVVDNGASLVLSNIQENGEYKIVSGADLTANVNGADWIGGWTGDNLYAWDEGSGLEYELELRHDASNVWVSAMISDVKAAYPDIDIDNIANDYMRDPEPNFVKTVLKDKDLSVDQKTRIINSVSNLAFAGGALSVAVNDLNNAVESIEGRVSMKSDAFTHEGLMCEWEKGNNLWIDVIGGKQRYKSLSSSGINKAGYDTDSYGFVLGFDRKVGGQSVILGGAVSYDHGSLDSRGEVLKTKNRYDSFGLHLYGAWSPNEKLNLVGTASYMHSSSDIDQTINAAGFNKAKADASTNMFSLGVRAESTLKAGRVNIVPHVGARYIYAKSSGYDTKVDGKKVWGASMDATNTVQFPIGVAFRGDIQTSSAWNVRPQIDLTLIPQAGDVNQKATVRNTYGVSDRVNGEFTGRFGTNVTIGVQADKGPATIGLRYGFTGGSKGRIDHGLKLEARYRF